MRLSTSYYPETLSFTCSACEEENEGVAVNSIESDFVVVTCSACHEDHYERVIYDD